MAERDRPAARTLGDLSLPGLPNAGAVAEADMTVTGVAVDSRLVEPGDVFVAVPGTVTDGATYAKAALDRGAAVLVATEEGAELIRADVGEFSVPVFVTPNPRKWVARLAAGFHDRQPEVMVAITGTNGKTSTAHFLGQIWQAAGHRAVAFGTTGVSGSGFNEPLGHTTPEPVTLHRLLTRLAEAGITHASMEASSHGLAQHRLDGVHLAAAGLTNITRDHMDYHASHEDYVAAKMRLFGSVLQKGGTAVLNADDASFAEARGIAKARAERVIAVGRGNDADLRIEAGDLHPTGQRVVYTWSGTRYDVALELIGAFQAENVGIAAGLALATGVPADTVFQVLPTLNGVRGRMELVARRTNGAAVYVDYAHTPDALSSAIAALRPHCEGRLICVFGAGGDRDPGKRPLMGAAVAEGADIAVVTDDNPRSEDPASIRKAVMKGASGAHDIGGRGPAILAAVDMLDHPGDCLLIAGKGHEQGQEIGGKTYAFDDGEHARAAVLMLDRRREGAA